jgi:hypothetical protein
MIHTALADESVFCTLIKRFGDFIRCVEYTALKETMPTVLDFLDASFFATPLAPSAFCRLLEAVASVST